jgi:hypothetical protein
MGDHEDAIDDARAALVEAMEKAGCHPADIHAFRTVGYMVTPRNASRLTPALVAAWDAAVAEWHRDHPGPT